MARYKEVKHGTRQHQTIVQAIRERRKFAEQEMTRRHQRWREDERKYLAYTNLSEEDEERKDKRENKGSPQYVTIEIPYSYAILLSMHTYWSSVFLGREPVFQFTARHGEPQQAVMAVEALQSYQLQVGKMLVPLYIWLLDAGKWGLGIVGNYWDEDYSVITRYEDVPETYLGLPLISGEKKKKRISSKMRTYQGNKLFNVRPYDWLPDPRVPITKFQQGEFCGRKTRLSYTDFVRGEKDGKYFNVERIKKNMGHGATNETEHSHDQIQMPANYTPGLDQKYKGMIDIVEMVIELIPKEWELGSGDYPEKWVFTVAEDHETLIGCEPLGSDHDQFPYSILEPEIDGYSLFKRSIMEILQPVQDTMNWLVNAHFYNVRAALNDQIVVDPASVMMKDLEKGGPGRIIRLKTGAFGADINNAIQQLPVTDVTKQHMDDAMNMGRFMQLIAGVNDNIMGVQEEGGRKTATEVRTSSTSAVNRMKTTTEYFSALGFSPLSEMMLSNTQQFYDEEMQLKIAGDLWNTSGASNFMNVTPDAISGFYDFVPVDGTMPVDRLAQVNLWKELMQMGAGIPDVAAETDFAQIFWYVSRLAGAKNIEQFKVEVTDDEKLMRRAEAGAVRPLGGGGGSGSGGSSGGTRADDERGASEALSRASQTGQVGSVGPTG